MLNCIICRGKGTFFVSAHFNIVALRKNLLYDTFVSRGADKKS